MSKPTIFFSHSSRDKEAMGRLKDLFIKKTGGAIEVFLSSDGQSIPLGRNWVYKVQEGLEEAALLIVFVTPQSIGSSWVYFEAGYSYSKGVRVVPTGFLGIDLTQLDPPLSLLQGFNITSADTLNNLIALTNDQFSHAHQPSFTPEDYEFIVGTVAGSSGGLFHGILDLLDDVDLSFTERDGLRADPSDLIPEICKCLEEQSVEHQSGDSFIHFRGVEISTSDGVSPKPLRFVIDPFVFEATLPVLRQILELITGQTSPKASYNFKLRGDLEVVEKQHKITARLYNDPVTLRPSGEIAFRDVTFDTGYYYNFSTRLSRRSNAYVKIVPDDCLDPEVAADLLKLLSARGVIGANDSNPYYDD